MTIASIEVERGHVLQLTIGPVEHHQLQVMADEIAQAVGHNEFVLLAHWSIYHPASDTYSHGFTHARPAPIDPPQPAGYYVLTRDTAMELSQQAKDAADELHALGAGHGGSTTLVINCSALGDPMKAVEQVATRLRNAVIESEPF